MASPSPSTSNNLIFATIQTNLEQWLQYREEFADEFIKHKALYLGAEPSPCRVCDIGDAPFRCLDCFSSGPTCQGCIVHQHIHPILHRLQVIPHTHSKRIVLNIHVSQKWNGAFFDDTSLFELGASHQLGHAVDDPCPLPSDPVTLTLFDVSGVHKVRIRYCFCNDIGGNSDNRHRQLLRARWFPATWNRPSTVFTFRLLDFLHKLQTQSKVNLYDFYASLVSVTDSAGQKPPVVCLPLFPIRFLMHPTQYRYNELSLALRIWVHLRQLRRGGCDHITGGFEALGPGSLAVECPACPHPGKNLVSPQVDR